MAIVALVFPLVAWLGWRPYQRTVVLVVSAVIALFGPGWFVERVFDLEYMPLWGAGMVGRREFNTSVRPKNSEESQMIEDPIVEEIRQHRKAHAAEHGNDLGRIVQALRKRERESDRPLLNPGPKKQLSPTKS